MGSATILSQEQAEVLSNDLAELIEKVTTFEKKFDSNRFETNIQKSIKKALIDNSLIKELSNYEYELQQNLEELQRVRTRFNRCSNERILKVILYIGGGAIFGSLLTILVQFLSSLN